ncbi:MAG: hypothetical protein A2Z21_05990 [Candidatus Fraserbacteria bacterium RBG_16_55_9]|uniref:Uncharacterized protein n=1 Tax=Fraserbacteria sp. (strain RBG_16_55_9) TaxID=1817864 RepID=A0A1F5V257_FRAXR|nr:MAG: hypothetical protein A2Z21_05990 [Candidatus Fraserbacteria bacterium RBG_16_55_9]
MRYFQQVRRLRWALVFVLVIGISLIGQIQGAVPSVRAEVLSLGLTLPESVMPPSGGGGGQLYANGQPIKEGNTIQAAPGQEVHITADCEATVITFALFIAAIGDQVSALGLLLMVLLFQLLGDPCLGGSTAALDIQAQQAIVAAPVVLGLQVREGAGRFKILNSMFAYQIETDNAIVAAAAQGDFTVGYIPATGTTVIAAHSGPVTVKATNGSSIILQSGQQVEVTRSGLGKVGPIGSAPGPRPTPPPSGGSSGLERFDANNNNLLDDPEFLDVIDAWIAGEVSGEEFFEALDIWISQEPISAAGLTSEAPHRDSVILTTDMSHQAVTFSAQDLAATSMRVEIFALNGQRVVTQETSGSRLRWNLTTSDGQLAANGVYLYVATVRGLHGKLFQSPAKKLVILR